MKSRSRKRGGVFLCFGTAAETGKGKRRPGPVDSIGKSEETWRMIRSMREIISCDRALEKIRAFFTSLNRSGKRGKNSDRSPEKKEPESSVNLMNTHDDRRALEASSSTSCSSSLDFSSSSSSSLTASSSCSSSASAAVSHLSLPKKLPSPTLPVASGFRSSTGAFLLVTGLMLMLFYGRVCAILWTSSWLCYVARRKRRARLTPAAVR